MTSFLAFLNASIADETYNFVEEHDTLPFKGDVFKLMNSSENINDLGHKLNLLFIEAIQSALAKAVALKHKRKVKQLIRTTYEKHEQNSAFDKFKIQFLDHELKYPDTGKSLHESLEELYQVINEYAIKTLDSGIDKEISYSVVVPPDFIDQLMAIDGLDGFLYQADLKGSANNQLYDTHILDICELRSLAEVNTKYLTVCTELVSLFLSHVSTVELPNFYQYNPLYFIFKVKHQD